MSLPRPSAGKIGKNVMLYAVVFGLQRAVSLLMLPVYTRYLTPADYGVLQLLEMTMDIAAILFTAGFAGGVQRLFFRMEDDSGRHRVLSTAVLVEMSLALTGTALMWGFAPFIHEHVISGAGSTQLVRIAAVNFSFSVLMGVPIVLLQAEQRAGGYTTLSALRLVSQVSLNVLFIVGFGQGVRGMLLSTLISTGVFSVVLAAWLLRRAGLRIDLAIARQLLRFGLPAQLSTAGTFILGFGDRYFLQASHGETAVGLYGLAYQFGFLMIQFSVAPFLQAWNPVRYQIAVEPLNERDAQYSGGFFYMNLALFTAATGIGVMVRPTLEILTAPAFHSAYMYVPLVLLAYVFHGWTLAVSFGIDYSGKTEYHAYAAWISAAGIVVAYAILIPPFGAMGAGLASLFGLALRFILVYAWGQRLFRINYGWKRSGRLIAPSVFAVAATWLVQSGHVLSDAAAGLGVLALYFAYVWSRVLRANEHTIVTEAIRKRVSAILPVFS